MGLVFQICTGFMRLMCLQVCSTEDVMTRHLVPHGARARHFLSAAAAFLTLCLSQACQAWMTSQKTTAHMQAGFLQIHVNAPDLASAELILAHLERLLLLHFPSEMRSCGPQAHSRMSCQMLTHTLDKTGAFWHAAFKAQMRAQCNARRCL